MAMRWQERKRTRAASASPEELVMEAPTLLPRLPTPHVTDHPSASHTPPLQALLSAGPVKKKAARKTSGPSACSSM